MNTAEPPSIRVAAADLVARATLQFPRLERALVAALRRPFVRRHLKLGAVACGYPRVLRRREIRIADLGTYRFYVNIGEPLGVAPYFFGDSGAAWMAPQLVREGDVCVDAGANAGHSTFLFASRVGARGKVIAFEPNPEFVALIGRSVALNGYRDIVEIDERALWEASGEEKEFFLSVNPENTGTSSLVNHGFFLSEERKLRIRTVTLDDALAERGIERVRVLKIDVERAEEHVLRGARRLLADQRVDFVVLEMLKGTAAQSLIESAGYRAMFIDPVEPRLVPIAELEPGHFGDYLYVRDALADETFARFGGGRTESR